VDSMTEFCKTIDACYLMEAHPEQPPHWYTAGHAK
jgi:hypothetical protein